MLIRNKKIIILSFLFFLTFVLIQIPAINYLDTYYSFQFYNFLNNTLVTDFFRVITTYTIVLSVITIAVLIYCKTKNIYKLIAFVGLSILQSLLVSIIQIIISRQRPFVINDSIIYLGNNTPIAFSFPSGHSTFAFFLAYFTVRILKLSKYQKVIAYLIAFLVAFSRLYLGAHYLLDIIGGGILGILLGMISVIIYNRILTKLP